MTDLPPPLPQPAPLPRRKRSLWPWSVALVAMAAVVAIYLGPLRIEVDFTDDAGHVPAPFEVTLRSSRSEKKVVAKNGRLHLIRGLWSELEVTDLSYLRSSHPVAGGKMHLVIERNALLKLKHAATGQPSVPQRGDPDPRDER
jgi:hypothetical protein